MTHEAETVGALVIELRAWIDRLFPDAERGERLERALDERFGDDARAVTDELCREVEAVAHDFSRHFALEYVADGSLVPDGEPPGWPPQDPREVQLRAGSVGEVTRRPRRRGRARARRPRRRAHRRALPGGRVRAAARRARRGAGPAAQRRRRSGDRDARRSTGCSAASRPTSRDVIYRDRTRQWWTTGRLADLALPPETPVSVLISERTFSSGEALAYHLQSQRQSAARRAADAGRRRPHHARARQQPRARVPARSPRPRRRHRDQLGGHGRRARRPLRAGRERSRPRSNC